MELKMAQERSKEKAAVMRDVYIWVKCLSDGTMKILEGASPCWRECTPEEKDKYSKNTGWSPF